MKILLVQPPLTQLNTSYPAITHLTAFLKQIGYNCTQMDLSIELINQIFTKKQLSIIFQEAENKKMAASARSVLRLAPLYLKTIEPVMRFLAGKDYTLATRICSREFLPESKRFPSDDELDFTFGIMGDIDKALHLCTLYLKDLSNFIKDTVDPNFELIRYAEKICTFLPEFTPLQSKLEESDNSLIDNLMLTLLDKKINSENPQLIGFSVPFPGNLYTTLRCAKHIKHHYPHISITIGGGYVNTELRNISDPKIFDYIDFLIFDDGELPLKQLMDFLTKKSSNLIRTITRNSNNELIRHNFDSCENYPFAQLPAPDYSGLLHNNYLNLVEQTNPMHRLWSNGRWNKIILAHGCYWAKCAFCDTSLDYIGRFTQTSAKHIVDKIEQIIDQTQQTGFHFVDEAAPPALLKQIALEIIDRGLSISYWTNIRFEKAFTVELATILSQSGCIAVSGGLEVASNRILQKINKGVTIETAASCMQNLSNANIMVHTYLMYGFPTQTLQETVDSLEVVRVMFENGLIDSAFWHRYAMTIHSPSGINPSEFGVINYQNKLNPFANNEIPFSDGQQLDFEEIGHALFLATYNYMRGTAFDLPLQSWFKFKIPKPKIEITTL